MKYYYRFGDDAYGWSDEFTFNAAPVPGPNVTTKVLAFGGIHNYCSHADSAEAWNSQLNTLTTF